MSVDSFGEAVGVAGNGPLLDFLWRPESLTVGTTDTIPKTSTALYTQAAAEGRTTFYDPTWFPNVADYFESMDLGFKFFDPESKATNASKAYFAGFHNVNSISLGLYVGQDALTVNEFLKWQNKICDDNGFYYPAANYWGTLTASMLNNQKEPVLTRQFTCVWPTNFDPFNLAYDSVGRAILKVSLAVSTTGTGTPQGT